VTHEAVQVAAPAAPAPAAPAAALSTFCLARPLGALLLLRLRATAGREESRALNLAERHKAEAVAGRVHKGVEQRPLRPVEGDDAQGQGQPPPG